MSDLYTRPQLLLQDDGLARHLSTHVGGVGEYAAEHLCRAGIGRLTRVDGDTVPSSIGTISYMPLQFGCVIASEVINVIRNKQ